MGIGEEEVFIVLQIVAIESCQIGFPGVEITDRLGSDRWTSVRAKPCGGGASGARSKK